MSYTRFAVYYVPPEGPLAVFGAHWLGWDLLTGRAVHQADIAGLDDVTMTPRKYGFHGTLKPPMRLADGQDMASLQDALGTLAARVRPAQCDGLSLEKLGRFLALTPVGDTVGLASLAAELVQGLDHFRAPAGEAELARRRKAGLSPAQEANLLQWGYPYVLEEFRFHLTLTGQLPTEAVDAWQNTVAAALPKLPEPFVIDSVGLAGERPDGRFELIQRYALTG